MVHPPLYNTTTWLYKDQQQGHIYVSADRSIDHLANGNKQGLQTGLSLGGLKKWAPVDKRQWWVNVNWPSSFSNQEASVWTWTRAKHNCHLLSSLLLLTCHDHGQRFQECDKAGSVSWLKGTGEAQAGVFTNLPGISLRVLSVHSVSSFGKPQPIHKQDIKHFTACLWVCKRAEYSFFKVIDGDNQVVFSKAWMQSCT